MKNHLYMGGTEIICHKFLGVFDQGQGIDVNLPEGQAKHNPTLPNTGTVDRIYPARERKLQDLLHVEQRDREYDDGHEYILIGTYQIEDVDGSIQYMPGVFYENDVVFFSFHLNDMIERLGRRIIPGDVLELTHVRDDKVLDDGPAINMMLEVTDVSREADGFDRHWWPHLWRVKAKMAKNSQELRDILDRKVVEGFGEGEILRDIMTVFPELAQLNVGIVEKADQDVPTWNFQNMHYYVVPTHEGGLETKAHWNPLLWTGDGAPPNGQKIDYTGVRFPAGATTGQWFLNTGMEPFVLYRRSNHNTWDRIEVDYSRHFSRAARIITSFINNRKETVYQDGAEAQNRQPVSKIGTARADPGNPYSKVGMPPKDI